MKSKRTLDAQLAAAIKRQEIAETQLDRRRKVVRKLIVEEDLATHVGYQKLANEVKTVKHGLHRCRLRQCRKRLSLRTLQEKQNKVGKHLQEEQAAEAELAATLEKIQANQDVIVDGVLHEA